VTKLHGIEAGCTGAGVASAVEVHQTVLVNQVGNGAVPPETGFRAVFRAVGDDDAIHRTVNRFIKISSDDRKGDVAATLDPPRNNP
jgi:hypothetical protein